ncbi:hypothetical protein ACWENA_26320 [Streptomyces sp. NPDC004779]
MNRAPALWGDPAATAAVRAAHTALFGPERVADWPASAASEDFALYGGAGNGLHGAGDVPLVYWMTGVTGPRQWAEGPDRVPPNHSSRFAPEVRSALPAAITALTAAALDRLDRSAAVGTGA